MQTAHLPCRATLKQTHYDCFSKLRNSRQWPSLWQERSEVMTPATGLQTRVCPKDASGRRGYLLMSSCVDCLSQGAGTALCAKSGVPANGHVGKSSTHWCQCNNTVKKNKTKNLPETIVEGLRRDAYINMTVLFMHELLLAGKWISDAPVSTTQRALPDLFGHMLSVSDTLSITRLY